MPYFFLKLSVALTNYCPISLYILKKKTMFILNVCFRKSEMNHTSWTILISHLLYFHVVPPINIVVCTSKSYYNPLGIGIITYVTQGWMGCIYIDRYIFNVNDWIKIFWVNILEFSKNNMFYFSKGLLSEITVFLLKFNN